MCRHQARTIKRYHRQHSVYLKGNAMLTGISNSPKEVLGKLWGRASLGLCPRVEDIQNAKIPYCKDRSQPFFFFFNNA
jgi:hypothetical protein